MKSNQVILVADDIEQNRIILRTALTKAGFEVVEATDGFEAEEVARRVQPDLILLDMLMAGRDGLTTCKILKADPATESIPIIFVTVQSDSTNIDDAFAAGGADYICKPFHLAEVITRINVQIKLRESEQELIDRSVHTEKLAQALAQTNAKLAEQARMDPLTSLLNRRGWEDEVYRHHKLAHRKQRSYGIIMLDVDYFKLYNDSQGHPAGDQCLRKIAATLKRVCRTSDVVGRYGGEEFIIYTPDCRTEGAGQLAERIRSEIAALEIVHPSSPISTRVTASLGVATDQVESLDEVVRIADDALYRAKRNGRNCVWQTEEGPTDSNEGMTSLSARTFPFEEPQKIVIGDHDVAARQMYVRHLENEGYLVTEVSDGATALEVIQHTLPNAVILDAALPKIDGLKCTELIKRGLMTRDTPIILIRNESQSFGLSACLNAGADESIRKPIDTAELSLRVRSMCRLAARDRKLSQSYQLRGEQTRILSLLLDFCQSLTTSDDLDVVLPQTLAAATEISSCRRVAIMLADPTDQYLYCAAATGIDDDKVSELKLFKDMGLCAEVRETGELHLFQEGESTFIADERPLFEGNPMACLPLGTNEQVVGVLTAADRFGSGKPDLLQIESLKLVTVIAGSALRGLLNCHARDEARDSIITALAELSRKRDNETGMHLKRVTQFTLVLAKYLQNHDNFSATIDDRYLYNLQRSVPLHDIGKVAIPDQILKKKDSLSKEEMDIMRTHAQIGAETIRAIAHTTPGVSFLEMAAEIAMHHHEWYDGTGYGAGLAGQDIPLCARLVAVSDVYDALTTRRPYKPALSHQEAVEIIVQRNGTHFDPVVIEAFLAVEDDFRILSLQLADEVPTEPVC